MSIATQISRLQTAKADLKTSIEAKGVIVPSEALLDTYDTYVDAIETGGGEIVEMSQLLLSGNVEELDEEVALQILQGNYIYVEEL